MKKILIVDDEPYMVRVVETTLSNKGFIFETAHGGKEAIELIKQSQPDLLILDVVMPDMDGIETLEQLKSLNMINKFPIILLTGKGHTSLNDEIITEANATVMTKPFSPIELQQAIDWVISDPMD